MLFLVSLLIAVSFSLIFGKLLKKYPHIFYVTAIMISAVTSYLPSLNTHNLPVFVNTYILGLFTRGALATALWCVVMITGALPNGSALIKKLMPIRGELSIFTAILTLGHNIGYGRTYFKMLFTNPERMNTSQISASICTIIMLIIMIPLTVLSFSKIRKKMKPKLWKKIQRTAYIFYALIYIHVMILTLPMAQSGRKGYLFSVMMYSFVFFGYMFFRIRKYILKNNNSKKNVITIVTVILTILATAVMTFTARNKKSEMVTKENISETVTVSTTTITTSKTTTITTITTVLNTVVSDTETVTTCETTTVTTTAPNQIIDDVNTSYETETVEESEESDIAELPEEENSFDEQAVISEEEDIHQPEESVENNIIEPQYIYNNGTFSASSYGYDGEVYITITIENDVITSITGYTDESESWYYESASGQIIPSILNTQDTYADVYSGATYSSNAIMDAVRKALESAKK